MEGSPFLGWFTLSIGLVDIDASDAITQGAFPKRHQRSASSLEGELVR